MRFLSSMRLVRDSSFSAIAAGFVTVLVSFASSVVIVFQAAQTVGASQAQIGSWILALGIGMGVTCIGLSLRYRMPVVTAWSTPAAAMLAVMPTPSPLPLAEAIGAFIVCAILISIAGFSGVFEKVLNRIPLPLAAGMLAGVLLRFGLDTFVALKTQPVLVLAMLASYLVVRRWLPRYAVIACLLVGVATAAFGNALHMEHAHLEFAKPEWMTPHFSFAAFLSITLPMFVVTMASQNVPGVAVIRASGYQQLPVSPVIGWTGFVNVLLVPLGAFSLNLAAITAAICMGPEAHPDPTRRYMAAVWAGVFYLMIGVLGATVVTLLAAFPKELVMAIAGIALLGTLGGSLNTAVKDESSREAALVTFLITASGLTLGGIGAAFLGLIGGVLTMLVLRVRTS